MFYRLLSRLGAEKYLSSRYFSSWLILVIDTCVSVFATFIAYLLIRGLFPNPVFTFWYGLWLLAGSCVLSVVPFVLLRTFRSIIRHSTLREIWKLGAAVLSKDVLMFFYVLLLTSKTSPAYAAISLGFLLDALVTLFLLLGLRLCMIVVYDLIKLKQTRRDNCRRVLVYGTGDTVKKFDFKPNGVVLSYAVINEKFGHPDSHKALLGEERKPDTAWLNLDESVRPDNPPAFIWTTADDAVVPAINSISYATAYNKLKLKYELHVYEHGFHGLSLADDRTCQIYGEGEGINPKVATWVDFADKFLRKI